MEPLRKPMGLKPGALTACAAVRALRHAAFEEWPLDQAHLGVPSRWMPEGAGPVHLVVLPVRGRTPTEVTVIPLRPAVAVRHLATHTFDLESLGAARTLALLASLATRALVVEIHYTEADDAAREIEALLNERSEPSGLPTTVVAPPDEPTETDMLHMHRAPGTCGVLLGDAGVVYAPDPMRIVELSQVAFQVWSSADGCTRRSERAAQVDAPLEDLVRIDEELRDSGLLIGD